MFEVIMPKLGLTMETGLIEKWLKKEGDKVEEGDILFEVMTDKVSLEVESYNKGILRKILRVEGEEVPVTEVVAYIGEADEEMPDKKEASLSDKASAAEEKTDTTKEEKVERAGPAPQEEQAETSKKKIFITPLAKKKAKELGIDYVQEAIKGSGPRGRIVKEDILSLARSARPQAPLSKGPDGLGALPAIYSVTDLKGTRKIIANKMTLSKQTIPHIIISAVANVSDLKLLREKANIHAGNLFGLKITYTDYIIKAASLALRSNIGLNSSLSEDKMRIYDDINIGLAVASDDGLVVPVIYQADSLCLTSIAQRRAEIIEKAKKKSLKMQDISGGTFTISNLGMYRIRSFTAIINPPQSSILTIGEIYKDTFVDEDDNIGVGHFMNLSVAVDHRIVDGADAAKFMHALVQLIENPFIL